MAAQCVQRPCSGPLGRPRGSAAVPDAHPLEANSTTPLNEPNRTAKALLAIYKHVLSTSAADQAEMGDYLGMCCELLAAYVHIRDGFEKTPSLQETPAVTKIADAPNVNVSENQTMRVIATRLRLHPVKKTDESDGFFERDPN